MELRTLFLLVVTTAITAAPAEKAKKETEDLKPAEGRTYSTRLEYAPAHSAPGPLYAPSAYASPRQGHVSSYNRRGHGGGGGGGGGEYGLRYSAPSSSYSGPRDYAHAQPAPAYASVPIVPAYGRQQDERGYGSVGGSRYGSGGYGPPNHISAQSQQHSQDPEYDPSKDPVSQYAAYIPVREYGNNKASNHRDALSIYGYRK